MRKHCLELPPKQNRPGYFYRQRRYTVGWGRLLYAPEDKAFNPSSNGDTPTQAQIYQTLNVFRDARNQFT